MVRLFVPEGEGQHDIVRRRPGALAARHSTTTIPNFACVAAAGITGFLSIVGRSRPGIFLKSTAIFGAFGLTLSVWHCYGQRELNRTLFLIYDIKPEPGKLWERTKHWTVEDATLGGGGLGLFTALNPRSLPGVSGWRRFFGSAMVGAAFGSLVGEKILVRTPPHVRALADKTSRNTIRAEYDLLRQNDEAKALLSPCGKWSLAVWTWSPSWLPKGSMSSDAGSKMASAGPGSAHLHKLQNSFTFNIKFEKEELSGPDVVNGNRVYRDDLKSRDVEALSHRLDRLQELKKNMVLEARYVWQALAKKERAFYDLVEENDEKDIFRREIQILNSIATQLVSREAIFAYHIADARKRLAQLQHNDSTTLSAAPTLSDPLQSEIIIESNDQLSPQITTSMVRSTWARQKELLASVEEVISKYDASEAHSGGAALDAKIKQFRQEVPLLRRNVKATGRLLSEFEEQVRKAEENAQK